MLQDEFVFSLLYLPHEFVNFFQVACCRDARDGKRFSRVAFCPAGGSAALEICNNIAGVVCDGVSRVVFRR